MKRGWVNLSKQFCDETALVLMNRVAGTAAVGYIRGGYFPFDFPFWFWLNVVCPRLLHWNWIRTDVHIMVNYNIRAHSVFFYWYRIHISPYRFDGWFDWWQLKWWTGIIKSIMVHFGNVIAYHHVEQDFRSLHKLDITMLISLIERALEGGW